MSSSPSSAIDCQWHHHRRRHDPHHPHREHHLVGIIVVVQCQLPDSPLKLSRRALSRKPLRISEPIFLPSLRPASIYSSDTFPILLLGWSWLVLRLLQQPTEALALKVLGEAPGEAGGVCLLPSAEIGGSRILGSRIRILGSWT